MEPVLRISPVAASALFLLASCGMQRTAQHSDDVYFMPSDEPVAKAKPGPEAPPSTKVPPADDYYDPNAAQRYGDAGNYYNAAYNDPYYYNYGRFGFNTGLGYQTGWNGPGWGMGMQWGYGPGMSSGWYGPSLSLGWGWGNYGWGGWNPWPRWGYSPWGWYDPWYNGWGYGGWGYGNYYGPYGGCSCCYTPIIIGGSSNVVVAHRPSLGGNGTVTGGTFQRRAAFRDPIGLTPAPARAIGDRATLHGTDRPGQRPGTSVRPNVMDRGERPVLRPSDRQPGQRPNVERQRGFERQAPSYRGGGSDRGGGSLSPSRSGGGGSNGGGTRSPGTIRQR